MSPTDRVIHAPATLTPRPRSVDRGVSRPARRRVPCGRMLPMLGECPERARPAVVGVVVLVLGVLAAACGVEEPGSGDAGPPTAEAMPRASGLRWRSFATCSTPPETPSS